MKLCFQREWGVVPWALVAALFGGCASPPPPVTPQLVALSPAGSTTFELERGRLIFVNACVNCHGLDSPTTFAPEQWVRIVGEMAKPAKIGQAEQAELLKYLLGARLWLLKEGAPPR